MEVYRLAESERYDRGLRWLRGRTNKDASSAPSAQRCPKGVAGGSSEGSVEVSRMEECRAVAVGYGDSNVEG